MHSEYSLPASEVQEGGSIPDAVLAECEETINSFPPRRQYKKNQPIAIEVKEKKKEKKDKKDKKHKKEKKEKHSAC